MGYGRVMKTTMISLTAALTLVLSLVDASPASAELLDVRDPNGSLAKIDAFLGAVPFEQAYKCGSYADYWRAKKRQVVRYEIGNCSTSSVVVFTTPGDKSSTDEEKVTRADYARNKGNQIRIFVEKMRNLGNDTPGLPSGSYLLVDDLTAEQETLRNGEAVDTNTVQVSVTRPSGGVFAAFQLTIARSLPMVAQIVSVANTSRDFSEMFRLLEHGVGDPRKGH